MSPATAVRGTGAPAVRSMRAVGTSATVVVADADLADDALALLAADLVELDEACSRFRSDSELRRLERSGRGRPTQVSSLLFDALEVACTVAARTAGIVDPTIGSALVELGYDRDIGALVPRRELPTFVPRPAPGWWRLELDPDLRTVVVPDGVHVDLGSTGKAFAADRSSVRIARTLGCGVLVNLGGDVAVAGPSPVEGWGVGIASSCTTAPADSDEVVVIRAGGLATSGTTARTWMRNGRRVHHIVDPWTGEEASSTWALVSVLADSCLEANGWSTAAVVWGEDAPGNLASFQVPARLVAADGTVVVVGPWPVRPPAALGPTGGGSR